MKNRSHRYDINRPETRHGHKYTFSIMISIMFQCFSIMMALCISQHLSNMYIYTYIYIHIYIYIYIIKTRTVSPGSIYIEKSHNIIKQNNTC